MELRKDTNLTLTAAVDRTPFAKVDGTPMNNVSDFAKVLDYIHQEKPHLLICRNKLVYASISEDMPKSVSSKLGKLGKLNQLGPS